MGGRVWRWCVTGLGVGLLPLLLAYGVRFYYLERPPSPRELLGAGEALLVIVSWLAVGLFELAYARPRFTTVRSGLAAVAVVGLTTASVAYGCLSADSVTGEVQTRWQAEVVTTWSAIGLVVAATVSAAAAGLAAPVPKGEQL